MTAEQLNEPLRDEKLALIQSRVDQYSAISSDNAQELIDEIHRLKQLLSGAQSPGKEHIVTPPREKSQFGVDGGAM